MRRTGLVVLVLGLAACTGHGLATATSQALVPQEPGDLTGSAWTLIGTGTARGVRPPLRAVLRVTHLSVRAGGACRALSLAFTDSGDVIRPRGTRSTLLCTKAAALTAVYTRGLAVVDTAAVESGSLVLTGPHSVRLVFNPRNSTALDIVDHV